MYHWAPLHGKAKQLVTMYMYKFTVMGNQHFSTMMCCVVYVWFNLTRLCLDGGEDKEVSSNPCKGNASFAYSLCFCWIHMHYPYLMLFFEALEEVQWPECVPWLIYIRYVISILTITWSQPCDQNMHTTGKIEY